jgi:hypothetical protein
MRHIGTRTIFVSVVSLTVAAVTGGPVAAWSHAGRWGTASGGGGSWSASGYRGGSASGGGGSWSASGFRGGSASGGGGSWSGTGYRGGTASGSGGSWHATTPYGTTAYGDTDHYYGGTYSTYHPPTVVDNYYSTGCYDCGGWNTAGAAAVGLAAGAALGAARTSAAATPTYPIGAVYTTLPGGCVESAVGGATYYQCGATWFKASFGANGVYYRVVVDPYS